MDKSIKPKFNALAESRRRKNQRRKSKQYNSNKYSKYLNHLIKVEKRIIKGKKSPGYNFLQKHECFKDFSINKTIEFPEKFSISTNYEESLNKIFEAVYSYDAIHNDTIKLSFKKCKEVQIICLFLLENLLLEVYKYKKKLQPKLKTNITNQIEIVKSKNNTVNKRLCVIDNRLLFDIDIEDAELMPIFQERYYGQKTSKSYIESRKKITTKKIVSFISKQMRNCSDYELSESGTNNLEGIISETIDNSEQHSFYKGEWFVCAYFFEDKKLEIGKKVVEVQLHFMNLGSTIYESFENRREENSKMSNFLDSESAKLLLKSKGFTKENIITLLSLNEGVSSLSYEEEGRGTGTAKLLKGFFEIGDHQDLKRKLIPKMVILSGKSMVQIDKKYKYVISKTGKTVLPLNDENNVYEPPNKSHLRNINMKFPGTLISLRVYLNNKNLKEKFS